MVINRAKFFKNIVCQKTLYKLGFQQIFQKRDAQCLMVTNWAELAFLIWHQLGPVSNH